MSTDPVRDSVSDTVRGHDDAAPARAIAGVTLLIGVVAGTLIVALLIVWYLLK